MPSLEEFLNKPNKKFDNWERLDSIYGCQTCNEDVDHAYFHEQTLTIAWVCSLGHESRIELV